MVRAFDSPRASNARPAAAGVLAENLESFFAKADAGFAPERR
jgi:hypothetical protein